MRSVVGWRSFPCFPTFSSPFWHWESWFTGRWDPCGLITTWIRRLQWKAEKGEITFPVSSISRAALMEREGNYALFIVLTAAPDMHAVSQFRSHKHRNHLSQVGKDCYGEGNIENIHNPYTYRSIDPTHHDGHQTVNFVQIIIYNFNNRLIGPHYFPV